MPFIYEPGQQTEKLASLAKDLDVGTLAALQIEDTS